MISIVFILINTVLCSYFIINRNASILGYLIFFQEVHLIPFNTLGISELGYIYYIIISLTFLFTYTNLEISKNRLYYILNNKVIWSIALLTIMISFHALLVGLKSTESEVFAIRYFSQVLPVIVFLILILEKKEFLIQLSHGIMIYGMLLFFILIISTEFLSTLLTRGDFREIVGMNPIAVSKAGGIVFIVSLIYLLDKKLNKYPKIICIVVITSIIITIISTSRGPIFALILSFFLFFIIKKGDQFKKFLSILIFAVFILITSFLIYKYINLDAFIFLIDRIDRLQDYETMRRYRRLLLAFDFLKNDFGILSIYFWIGMGPGGFSHYFGMGYVHNYILEFVLEYGFIGLVSILIFSTYTFHYSIKLIRSTYTLRYLYIPMIFIFLYLSSMVSGDIIANRNLLFVSIILVISIYHLKTPGIKFTKK
jgi:hypothetical protein